MIRTISYIIIAVLFGFSCGVRTQVEEVNDSKKLETNIEHSMNNEEIGLDIDRHTLRIEVGGLYMKLFSLAFLEFRDETEIEPPKKHLENYTIQIYESKDYFYVNFQPKSTDGDQSLDGGATSLGKQVSYTIDKVDFKIKARFFYK